MSWASRRRTAYASGVGLFFLVLIGGPVAYWYFSIPPTCSDGIQNQGETATDKGGPCDILDVRALSPSATLWARSFRVRSGTYNAVAYIQNPNQNAGVQIAPYRFGLYDERNVLVAEREGVTYIMPGAVTPVFSGAVDTGNRVVAHTYFEFTRPLVWERLTDTSGAIEITNTVLEDAATAPRITASAHNTSVVDLKDLTFMVAVFDPAGNAFAASQTALDTLAAGETQRVIFTWPDPFNVAVGRISITPLSPPEALK